MQNSSRPKVLLVDDEKLLRTGTKRLLESEGYFVDTAENGSEGIKLGSSSEYDVALIDLKMPDVDGIHVLNEILKIHPQTICIIATGYASYETAIEATKAGAFSYIPKPFTPDEILLKLKEAYYKRQLLLETEKLRREREERLLEVAFEKTRLNTIINSITDGLLVVNKDGQAVLYNPSALKYLQLDKIKIEEYIIDKLHAEIAGLINKILSAQKFEHKSYSTQIDLNRGGQIFVEATSSPVPHPDGSLAGVVVVIKDITELKKLEILKSRFVSMVSHELKAPIAAVYGYLRLLSDETVNLSGEQKKNYILRSQLRLDSLLKMVNDLLDISRIEMKKVSREIKEIQILSVIKSAAELFQNELKEKNISLSINSNDGIPAIYADYDEITRVLTNLLSNAIKYNKAGGTVAIHAGSTESYLTVEISDTGIGMKPAEKERLFREFFRAKNEKTKNINGTGLGLSIIKRIVDFYSGKIEVESEWGKGTCFKISFPLRSGMHKTENEEQIILSDDNSFRINNNK